jgi:hypothetical protein
MDNKEIISLGALIVAALSLIVAFLAFILNYRKNFRERLRIEISEFANSAEDHIHVYKTEYKKEHDPSISQIAKWAKLSVSNLSNKPITIVSASYQEDQKDMEALPFPFVKEVVYKSNEVSLADALKLPFKLDSHEAIVFYALLPVSIKRNLGEKILPIMTRSSQRIPTKEMVKASLDRFEQELHEKLNKENPVSWMSYDRPTISSIISPRELIKERGVSVRFLDRPSGARDGYIYQSSNFLHARLFDWAGRSNNFSFTDQQPPFEDYQIILCSTNKTYRTYLTFTDFDRFKPTDPRYIWRRRLKQYLFNSPSKLYRTLRLAVTKAA